MIEERVSWRQMLAHLSPSTRAIVTRAQQCSSMARRNGFWDPSWAQDVEDISITPPDMAAADKDRADETNELVTPTSMLPPKMAWRTQSRQDCLPTAPQAVDSIVEAATIEPRLPCQRCKDENITCVGTPQHCTACSLIGVQCAPGKLPASIPCGL
jgi:hypothetical protein